MTLTPDSFRNLARSSPWRWDSLRFTVSAPGDDTTVTRFWVRRPGALRVENAEGQLLYSTTNINDSRADFYVADTRASWLLPPQLVAPVYDDQGLVTRRPQAAYGEPIYQDAHFAALLDPAEIAGNAPVAFETPYLNPTLLEDLREEDIDGRRAWVATLTRTPYYRPAYPGFDLVAEAPTEIALDVDTAVCVRSRALDGPHAGAGHDLKILGVDEYMLDELFIPDDAPLTDVREHISWSLRSPSM